MLIRPHSITRSPRRLSGILLLLTGVASALGPSGAGAQTTHGLLDVEVARVDGDPALGLLQAISPSEITLIRDDGSNAVVPRNDALELRPRQPEAVADEPAQLVLMANGDRLVGAVESMDEESVRLNWSGTRSPAELIVPLELIRGILLHQPSQREDRERLTRQWSLHTGAQDRLCLRTGAILEGELLGLFDGRFRLQTSLGPIESARDEVAAFAANPELLSNVPPPASYVLAETTDGSWISFSTLELADGQVLRGETGWGASIEMALTQVLRLCFFGPRVSALPDLTPANYEFRPYLTETHPLVINRNVHGGWLQIAGASYPRGLGLTSHSVVTYDLDGAYKGLRAVLGVDDMAGPRGSVTFRIEVDGRIAFESGQRTASDGPLIVGPVSVEKVKVLRLIVDYADFGNIQDVADWCDAVLTR